MIIFTTPGRNPTDPAVCTEKNEEHGQKTTFREKPASHRLDGRLFPGGIPLLVFRADCGRIEAFYRAAARNRHY